MTKFMVGDTLIFDEDIKDLFEAFRLHMTQKSHKDLVTLTVRELIRIHDLPNEKLPRLWGRVASITGLPRGCDKPLGSLSETSSKVSISG